MPKSWSCSPVLLHHPHLSKESEAAQARIVTNRFSAESTPCKIHTSPALPLAPPSASDCHPRRLCGCPVPVPQHSPHKQAP